MKKLFALFLALILFAAQAHAVDRVLILAASDSVIDIERDLHCVPLIQTTGSGSLIADANANTAKLQAAFDKADGRVSDGTHYVFVVPNKVFAIGTTTLTLPSGVALIGAGGICDVDKPEAGRQGPAVTLAYINGPTLMRITQSANPMLRLEGYGNVISGIAWRGAWYYASGQFRKSEDTDQSDPYYAGCGIEIRNAANELGQYTNSGHHTIDGAFSCCTVGIKHTWTGVENQADVCTFPRLEFHQCPTAWQVNNQQSIAHHFGHVYYYAPLLADAGVLAPSVVFDCIRGSRISVENATITGPCTVVQADDVDGNTGGVVINYLYADGGCFRASRPFRLLHMKRNRDFMFRCTGSFAWADKNLATQYYNLDGSELFSGADSHCYDDGKCDIKIDLWRLSTHDAAKAINMFPKPALWEPGDDPSDPPNVPTAFEFTVVP